MTHLHPLRRQLLSAILGATALTGCELPTPPSAEQDTDLPTPNDTDGPQIDTDQGTVDTDQGTVDTDQGTVDTDAPDTGSGTGDSDTDTDVDTDVDTDLVITDCDLTLPDAAQEYGKQPWGWAQDVHHCAAVPLSGCVDTSTTDAATYLEDALGHPPGTFINNGRSVWFTCGPDSQVPTECCYTFSVGFLAVPGRPFVAQGEARTAPVQQRGDWGASLADLHEAIDALSPSLRDELAARWTHAARIEHASVASFAAFTLDLLQHGAPPDLLLGATAAAGDEVRHAQEAFGLASRFAGASRGPGPLDTTGVAAHPSLAQATEAAFIEGCLNETLAAAVARSAAETATHPALATQLHRVADDEARHAALAWRFVRWAVQQDPSLGASLVAQANAAKPATTAPSGRHDAECAAWGHPDPATLARVHVQTFAEVIEPCLAAVLGQPCPAHLPEA